MAILVATDIAARGLDIDALPHVVIETLLGQRMEQEIIPGFAPDRSIRPQPIQTPNWPAPASIGRPMALPGERLARS